MRGVRPHKFPSHDLLRGIKDEAKPLFQKILAVSLCGSIFWPEPGIPRARKQPGMNILGEKHEKKCEETYPGQNPRHVPPKNGGTRTGPRGLSASVPCGDAAVFLQPLQLFSYFYFSVPGILGQAVAFAGEDQELVGDA